MTKMYTLYTSVDYPNNGLPVSEKYIKDTPAYNKIVDKNLSRMFLGSCIIFLSTISTAK